jgi:hypothetical protein
MDAQTFLMYFEKGKLHPFPHHDHIYMAWLYLRRDGWDEGYQQIQAGLKHFAAVQGQPEKYHETITRFWALLVHHAIAAQPEINKFSVFRQKFPLLFEKFAIRKHYSDAILWSATARQTWVEPDLLPMPV